MAISIFPSTAAEFVSNNFVIDMNDTSNNTADTGGVKQAGPYSISFSSGDSSFDVYLIDEDGNSVGYSNNTSIVASGLFTTVVILGVASDEVVSFLYQGSVNNADGEGDEPGAGAYLESITPSDLPSIDDTATVTGGNFGADTEIFFDSGATSLAAKNITVNNSTELIVTRPDNLDAGLDPWTLRAVTTGVPEPTGTNANILTDAVTAGAVPSWVTTELVTGEIDVAYTDTLEATDPDGGAVTYAIVSGTLPTGLSLNSLTGVISGTPTSGGQTFTAGATDEGGNQTTREFTIALQAATGGTVTSAGGYIYHTFTSTDDFIPSVELTNVQYLVVAGGGGGSRVGGGAGGGGGLLNGTVATVTAGTYTATIGAGGTGADDASNGSDSSFSTFATATGGGGGKYLEAGGNGGSGGGASSGNTVTTTLGGSPVAGQGFKGGDSTGGNNDTGGAGGGAGQAGENSTTSTSFAPDGGNGLQFSDWATATSTGADGGYYAGGGGNSTATGNPLGQGGLGGGGDGKSAGVANTGGGAGSGNRNNGGSGIVIVRYA